MVVNAEFPGIAAVVNPHGSADHRRTFDPQRDESIHDWVLHHKESALGLRAASVHLDASGGHRAEAAGSVRAKAPPVLFVIRPILERGVIAVPWAGQVIAKIQG